MSEETFMGELLPLIIRGSGVKFIGNDLRNMRRPCVYMFLRNGKAVYVGMSGTGITRPFCARHGKARECIESCTEMLIWFCETKEKAIKAENLLIGSLRPPMNERSRYFILNRRLKGIGMNIQRVPKGAQ